MFNISKPSGLERKREFHSEAPAAKHEYRLRRYGPLRMAGAVWEETISEKLKKAAKARYAKERSGIGFGGGDRFGPDESYATKEALNNTPDPKGYRV
jgi:hypothetical protein